jgi:hypothetical protein
VRQRNRSDRVLFGTPRMLVFKCSPQHCSGSNIILKFAHELAGTDREDYDQLI